MDSPKSGGAEGVKGASGKPPCRARRRDSPCMAVQFYVAHSRKKEYES